MTNYEKLKVVPISVIVPTRHRSKALARTLESLANQDLWPAELIVVDASEDPETLTLVQDFASRVYPVSVECIPADIHGAAAQRNKGVSVSSQPYVWFIDDDIVLEPECLARLWMSINSHLDMGGANAMITNQNYHPPGRGMRLLLALLGCPPSGSLAGRCSGPALNFLPALEPDGLPRRTDWLNTTCTLYRRAALPSPPFLPFFQGYSLMEDLALSLEVGKRWTLANCPDAKIYHDSQPADYKSQLVRRQAMEVANRWFVLSKIMGHSDALSLFRLLGYQGIGLLGLLAKPGKWVLIPGWFAGTLVGMFRIMRDSSAWSGYPRVEEEK